MDTWTLILTFIIGAYTFYHYFVRDLDYFKKVSIPYKKPIPILGNSYTTVFRQQSMTEYIESIYKINPQAKYVGMFDFIAPTVVIRDLDLIKSITVKNFDHFVDHRSFADETIEPLFGKNLFSLRGQKWKDMRNLLSPAFTSSKMKAMFKLMSECATNFADYWQNAPAETRNCVNTKDAFTRYTNDVIATCAFGISVNSVRDRDNEFYRLGRDATTFTPFRTMKFFLLRSCPWVAKVFGMRVFGEEIERFFKNLVETTIRTRDEKGIVRPDMIQLMMESRGKRGDNELTIEDMTSQALIFFFGGFESTSTLMCFAAHEIAVNPDIQKRLHDEIDEVLRKTNGDLTYDALYDLKYLDAVLDETLRLYPVAAMLDRMCVKDFELPPTLLGRKPYLMKKGSYLWVPVYGIHMDPQYFPDPTKFDPDRFLEENRDRINPSAYMPFGLGPRMCIGNRFALLETKVMLFHLLARCELKTCEKTPIPIVLTRKSFVMMPDGGFWLKFQPRSTTL